MLKLIHKDLVIKPYTFDMTGFKDKKKKKIHIIYILRQINFILFQDIGGLNNLENQL